MNKHIEKSSWEENLEHYPPKTDWVVVLVTVALSLAGAWFIVEHVVGADELLAVVAEKLMY
jgi:hypothetical protein